MNPLELRKIVVIGCCFDAPEGAPLLDRDGLPANPLKYPIVMRVAFWVPAARPYQRGQGQTQVIDARAFEVQSLKDGAIVEIVEDLTFPQQPSLDEMRRRLMPVWEGLTVESLGVLPNAAPVDRDPKLAIQFYSV